MQCVVRMCLQVFTVPLPYSQFSLRNQMAVLTKASFGFPRAAVAGCPHFTIRLQSEDKITSLIDLFAEVCARVRGFLGELRLHLSEWPLLARLQVYVPLYATQFSGLRQLMSKFYDGSGSASVGGTTGSTVDLSADGTCVSGASVDTGLPDVILADVTAVAAIDIARLLHIPIVLNSPTVFTAAQVLIGSAADGCG